MLFSYVKPILFYYFIMAVTFFRRVFLLFFLFSKSLKSIWATLQNLFTPFPNRTVFKSVCSAHKNAFDCFVAVKIFGLVFFLTKLGEILSSIKLEIVLDCEGILSLIRHDSVRDYVGYYPLLCKILSLITLDDFPWLIYLNFSVCVCENKCLLKR